MADRFDKMIRELELETTNLKTAHDRSLGAVDFYSKTASTSVTTDQWLTTITITATVASGELTPGFEELQLTVSYNGQIICKSFSTNGNSSTWVYYARLPDSSVTATVTAKIISASKLSNLTVSAVGGEA